MSDIFQKEKLTHRVLIIDDEPGMLQLLTDFLNRNGYKAQGVSCVRDGLTLLKKKNIDLVISDIMMPDIDGLEGLAKIKEIDEDAIVIMMTGFGSMETAVKAMRNGAYDYILKPFNIDDLELIIKRGMKAKELVSQNRELMRTLAIQNEELREHKELLRKKVHLANKKLERKVVELRALNEIGKALSSELHLQTLLRMIVDAAAEKLEANKGSLMLIDYPGNIGISVAKGLEKEIVEKTKVNVGEGVAGWVVEKGIPVLVKDISNDNVFQETKNREYSGKSFISVPLISNNKILGVLNITEKSGGRAFTEDDLDLLMTLGSQAAITIENATLYESLQKNYFDTIKALNLTIEQKDPYTSGHSIRVTHYALITAQELGLNPSELQVLEYSALLHDIGKIGISERILEKTGRLTPEEYNMMQEHPVRSEMILKQVQFLEKVHIIVRQHHERFDGTGYPDGLEGEEINLLSRIISVADAFDAMTSRRRYREALTTGFAISELQRKSGSQFDGHIVDAFIRAFGMDSSMKYNLSVLDNDSKVNQRAI
jgi:putative nucleotidyltransferase with HDIG domain